MGYDPTGAIRAAQSAWKAAYTSGNTARMNAAHAAAEAARSQAGWGSGGDSGSATESRMSDRSPSTPVASGNINANVPVASGYVSGNSQLLLQQQLLQQQQEAARQAEIQRQEQLKQQQTAQMGQMLGSFSNIFGSNNYAPYEQALKDLIANHPSYTAPGDTDLQAQAKTWAELQIDPQKQALQKGLESVIQALNDQSASTNAAYSSIDTSAQRLLADQSKLALESAISRGGGSAGAVEWLRNKQQAPILEQQTKSQQEKAAALAGIANQLTLVQKQASDQGSALDTQLGKLQSSRLADLTNLTHSVQTGDWQQMLNATQGLANLATQNDQYNKTFASTILPYYTQTAQEKAQLPIDWTKVIGQVPGSSFFNTTSNNNALTGGMVPLRTYADSQNKSGSVSYDPSTDEVIIGGKRYSANAMKTMGGQMVDNYWYMPPSIANTLLGVA